ncbi:MAG: hypothetical protein EOP50_03155 [Sphingobacteriales bacterium]|nr:MAG: hypothetical protein EOP50_03155 [Sphingobacteriales bacterium]
MSSNNFPIYINFGDVLIANAPHGMNQALASFDTSPVPHDNDHRQSLGHIEKSMVTFLFARVDFGFCDWLA